MNIALWIVQVLLSVMMIVIGSMKTFMPVGRLSNFSWTSRSSLQFIRFVGVSELLIGAGLILPQLTGILPLLTPLAALALYIIMILAVKEHIKHKETEDIWKNILIMMLTAFVMIGRFFPYIP